MSYNPYIQRILIEQIQEFESLDLQDFIPVDPNKLQMLAYEQSVNRFYMIEFPSDGSGNVIVNKATLATGHTVNTDDLSTPRGFEFRAGWDLDAVVEALCNPPVQGILTFNATPYLVEVNTPTNITLSYNWDKKSEGDAVISSVQYYRGTLPIGTIPDLLTATNVGLITYKVEFTTLATPQFPASTKTGTDTVKAIYPFFIGAQDTSLIGDIGTLDSHPIQPLHDINATHYMMANFNTLVPPATPTPQKNYWFATHQSMDPISWVAVDSNGVEDNLNKGPIGTAFSNIGNLTYKGNSYKIWMGTQPTFYNSRIKIKF